MGMAVGYMATSARVLSASELLQQRAQVQAYRIARNADRDRLAAQAADLRGHAILAERDRMLAARAELERYAVALGVTLPASPHIIGSDAAVTAAHIDQRPYQHSPPPMTDAERLAASQREAMETARIKGRLPPPPEPVKKTPMPANALGRQHKRTGLFVPEAFSG